MVWHNQSCHVAARDNATATINSWCEEGSLDAAPPRPSFASDEGEGEKIMGTKKDEILAIAKEQGYEGKSSGTIAEAVNALGSVIGGGGGGTSSALSLAHFEGSAEDIVALDWHAIFVPHEKGGDSGLWYPRVEIPVNIPSGVGSPDLSDNPALLSVVTKLKNASSIYNKTYAFQYDAPVYNYGNIDGGGDRYTAHVSGAQPFYNVYTEYGNGVPHLYIISNFGNATEQGAIESVAQDNSFGGVEHLAFDIIPGSLVAAIVAKAKA